MEEKIDNSVTSTRWCYTLNNYTEDEVKFLKELPCKVHYCGYEVGEKKGTPHLQGYIVFNTNKRFSTVKKINKRISWKLAKGNDEDNYIYCFKEKNECININLKAQGKRTDLEKVIDLIKQKKTIKEIANECPREYIKYHNGIEKLRRLQEEDRDFKPYVEWIWGPSESGKTRLIREKEKNLWMSLKNLKWWDGYENQEAVVFDDFRKDFCTFHELLRILDRYPYRVEVKGGSVPLNSKRMYITSCYHPEDVYNTREDIYQLTRRIDVITFKGKKGDVEANFRQKFVQEVDSDVPDFYL